MESVILTQSPLYSEEEEKEEEEGPSLLFKASQNCFSLWSRHVQNGQGGGKNMKETLV